MSDSKSVLEAFRRTIAFNLGAIEREITDFQAIKEPTDIDHLRARALGAFYAGFYQQARPMINALVGLEPTERNIVKLAQVEQRLGDSERAITIAQRAVSSYPTSFSAYEVLASSLLEAGEYEKSLDAAKFALELEPDSPRMRAILMLSQFAANTKAGIREIGQTGDAGMDSLMSTLFVGGAPSDTDVADLLGRFSERELSSIMSRVEPVAGLPRE